MARDQRGEPELPPGPARDLVDLYRRLRLNTKLTGGQIAVKAHMSAGHVSDVLRGRKAPGPDTATKIANALGARMEEIQLARQLAEELAELNQYNRRRARGGQPRSQADGGRSAVQPASTVPEPGLAATIAVGQRPRVLDSSEIRRYRVLGLPGPPERFVGTVTGDIRRVRCARVWVNSENTEMLMARFSDYSISSIIRYEGAIRDDLGQVTDDIIYDELARKLSGRRLVPSATAIVTGAGELARFGVSHVVHVAAVQGEPGAGFRQVREVGRCVTSVLAEVDKIRADPPPETILFPLLGTGSGGGELMQTISALTGSVLDYFTMTPRTRITTVYFLAYLDIELTACEALFGANKRLGPVRT
jgi:transcriptional regulator with XRE-family HTH domain